MKAAATVKATAMEGTANPMGGSTTVKAAPAAAVTTAPGSLCERRTSARHGQGRHRANYKPTPFPSCHDSSPSFL